MGILLAFAVGYVVGARAGSEGLEEVVESLKAVRDSPEFKGFVAAMRSHVGSTLRLLGEQVKDTETPLNMQQVLDRFQSRLRPEPTSDES